MRLTELEPRWFGFKATGDAKQGVTFLCPCCRRCRLGAAFDVPICGNAPIDMAALRAARVDPDHPDHPLELADTHLGGPNHWHREGDSFENLTLTPSLDCSHFGHWHGFITNGEVR